VVEVNVQSPVEERDDQPSYDGQATI